METQAGGWVSGLGNPGGRGGHSDLGNPGGRGSQKTLPSVGGVWIFSGITQFESLLSEYELTTGKALNSPKLP